MVGIYDDATGQRQGFEYRGAAVPAPPAFTLLASDALAVLGYAWRQ